MSFSVRCCALLCLGAALAAGPVAAQNRGDCGGGEPTEPSAVIAGPDEPGERLEIEGRVLTAEGEPVAGATVHLFHTDAEGYYSPGGMDESDARLCALLRTDGDGRYRVETVRPAHYASGGGPPAHVHFRVWGPRTPRQSFTLFFAGDPRLGERGRQEDGAPTWATVRPVETGADGVQRVVRDLKLR